MEALAWEVIFTNPDALKFGFIVHPFPYAIPAFSNRVRDEVSRTPYSSTRLQTP
jgi:hypothetical protein